MSYPHYPSQHPYPYSAYHHPATPGTYAHPTTGTYPPAAYQTPGAYPYGAWPYPYSYFPPQPAAAHQAQNAAAPRPAAPATTAPPAVASPTVPPPAQPRVTTPTTTQAPARQTTFTSYTPATFRERESSVISAAGTGGASGSRSSRKQSNMKGLFAKELRSLMYGFGDDRNPANDTVNVMEEILIEYIMDVCQSTLAPTRRSRLSIEDLRRALSRPADAKKLARMEELLFMQEDIKRARAQFQEDDIKEPGF